MNHTDTAVTREELVRLRMLRDSAIWNQQAYLEARATTPDMTPEFWIGWLEGALKALAAEAERAR